MKGGAVMYIRKQTLWIGGILVVGFVVGNVILVVQEHKSGKKITLHSVIDLVREAVQAFEKAY
jgi:hypothetical protein